MQIIRLTVWCAALCIALAPLAALAADTTPEHLQAELVNAEAQFANAQQQASDLQAQATFEASNARMIALTRSEAMRQRQLNMVSNANALEQIAAALADAARANGEFNARNSLAVAQLRASALVAGIDAKLANAEMQAQVKGRTDELANAQAQAQLFHQLADYIAGQQAETNIANARLIAQNEADAIHTSAIAQQQNGIAMGANQLLAADTTLQAGELNAANVQLSSSMKASDILARAAKRLENAQVRAGVR